MNVIRPMRILAMESISAYRSCAQGEHIFGTLRKFCVRQGVGVPDEIFKFAPSEYVPMPEDNPKDARPVRRGSNTLDFKEFVEALGADAEREDNSTVIIEIKLREHLAPNGLVAGSEDEFTTPSASFGGCFDDIRKAKEDVAQVRRPRS